MKITTMPPAPSSADLETTFSAITSATRMGTKRAYKVGKASTARQVSPCLIDHYDYAIVII